MAEGIADRFAAPRYSRVCAQCGDAFDTRRPGQRFCRPSCRWRQTNARRRQPPPRLLEDDQEDVPCRFPFE
jgi:hypothetical protein